MAARDRQVTCPDELYAWRDYVRAEEGGPDAIDGASASTVRFVLDELGRWQNSTRGASAFVSGFWVSESTLARKTRVSKRQVRRVLAAFAGELFIRDRPKKGSRYTYHLLLPESADTSALPQKDCGHQRRGVGRSRPQTADTSAPQDVPPRDKKDARARDAMPEGPRSPALDDGPAAVIGPGGCTHYRVRVDLQKLGIEPEAIPELHDDALELLDELRKEA